jgi:hypothetical protein
MSLVCSVSEKMSAQMLLVRKESNPPRSAPPYERAEVFFVPHDDVVQAIPADGADQSFDHWIFPGGARRNTLLFKTQVLDSAREAGAIDGISIPEQ